MPDTWALYTQSNAPVSLGVHLQPFGSIAPPSFTATLLVGRYLLIKIWLPGNRTVHIVV